MNWAIEEVIKTPRQTIRPKTYPLSHIAARHLGVWVVLAIFAKKTSSFRLPYQRPSSSADCARELFNGSNGSTSLVDCTLQSNGPGSGWLVVAPAPQPEPASRLRSATLDVSFLRSDSRCRRYVSDMFNVAPRYLGSEQKSRVSVLKLTFSSRLASLLLRWKTADTVFVVLSFT